VRGEPSHIELGAPDATRARAFYESLFGWTFEQYGQGDQASFRTPTGRGFGRFSTCRDDQGVPFGLHQLPAGS